MPTSPKPKLLRGTNGPEEINPDGEELIPAPDSSNNDRLIPDPVSSPDPEPVVAVVEDSGEGEKSVVVNTPPPPLSASDIKLARKMNKAIADSLGLSGKSRSVKI